MKAMMYHTDGSPAALERKEEDRNLNRRTAVLVGALFLISTATFIVSNVLMTPILAPTTSWLQLPTTRSS